MSNPSFSNIDLWLFELAEGNLTPAQVEQLELFLLQHPELDVDRDVWEMATVGASAVVYEDQESLKKKRPVAWYAFGSVTVVSTVLIGWLLLGGSDVHQNGREFSFNSRYALETRGLTGQHDSSNSSPNESDNEIGSNNHANSGFVNQTSLALSNPMLVGSPNLGTSNPTAQLTSVARPERFVSNGSVYTSSIYNSASTDMVLAMVGELERRGVTLLKTEDLANRSLATHAVHAMDVLDESDYVLVEKSPPSERAATHGTYGISSEEYKVSFKSRVNSLSRKLQRMMDNPVALKNFRDPYFHVPGMLPNDLNFSSTGTMLSTRVQAISRLQWYGQENEQMMNQLAIDGYAYGMRGGIGLQVNHAMYNDGGMNVASAALTYSPKLSISKKISVEPSLRFKMGNKSLAKSKMEDVTQVEVERGNIHEFYPDGTSPVGKDLWYQDLGVGLMVNTEWFFVGAQLDNLFRHKDNVYAQDLENPRRSGYHFVGSFGTDWVSRKENVSLSPYFVYQKNEKLSEAWLGANIRWNWFTMGGSISSNLEPAASVGLKFDHFALSYNADYVESTMTGQRSLSHQVTLRFVSKPSRFGRRLLNL